MGVFKGWSGRIIMNNSVYLEDLGSGSDTIPFTKTLSHFPITKTRNSSNNVNDLLIQYALSYNASADSYTDMSTEINNATIDDVILPPIFGSGTGDAFYFGDNGQFNFLHIQFGIAGVYAGGSVNFQYYNGSWVNVSNLTDETNGFSISGLSNISWNIGTDWNQTTVNGQSAYWVRAIAQNISSITTTPQAIRAWMHHTVVYVDNASVSNNSYTINSSLGTISLNVSSANSSIAISYSYYRTVGYATGITFSQVNNNENVFVIGSRTPQEIYEGNIEIEGSIDEFHVDRRASQLTIHDNISQKLSDSTMVQFRADPSTIEFFIRDCKFNEYTFDMSQDAFIAHGITFNGKNISTS